MMARILALGAACAALSGAGSQEDAIRLVVRGDDMGAGHAINEACIKSYKEGIVRSVEVLVPGAWFPEAAKMLAENPGLDVGVHLCLTSEWEAVKWGPLTGSPSISDKNGYFYPMNRQRKDFPPNTGFLDAGPKLEEVERELRAQIEMAKRHIPRVSHLTAHMGTAVATPELKALTLRLAQEYGLPLENPALKGMRAWKGSATTPEEKEAAFVEAVGKLGPGTWLFVEHPGFDVPEMRAMGHLGYTNVAADREGVTRVFTSEKVKAAVREKGVKLVSYAEVQK
jgi:hypothetical protein